MMGVIWDCHMHMILDGEDWKNAIHRHSEAPRTDWIRQQLQRYQQLGITYLRDGGDRFGAGKAARELAPEYGITYRSPGAPLCLAGHYGSFIGKTYADLKEYACLVKTAKQEGADFIKIMISGLMDFDHFGSLSEAGLEGKEIKELIHIAHEEGMAVSVHGNGGSNVLAAAQAGVDSVEHGAYLTEETLSAMAEAGTVWVPTLSTIGNLRGTGRFSEADVEKILESALQNVSRFAQLGGLIAPGTDAGAWAVPHGIQTEFSLLRQALGAETDTLLEKGTAVIQRKF